MKSCRITLLLAAACGHDSGLAARPVPMTNATAPSIALPTNRKLTQSGGEVGTSKNPPRRFSNGPTPKTTIRKPRKGVPRPKPYSSGQPQVHTSPRNGLKALNLARRLTHPRPVKTSNPCNEVIILQTPSPKRTIVTSGNPRYLERTFRVGSP